MAGSPRRGAAEEGTDAAAPPPETRLSNLQRSIANHWIGALAVAAVLALGAIGAAIDGGRKLADLFGGGSSPKVKRTPPPVSFAPGDLVPVSNERFAFSFRHPKTWEQQVAFNNDGSAFRAPGGSAELRAFGVNASDGPSDVLERVEFLAQREKQSVLRAGGQILSSDLRFVAWDGPNDDRTPASRLVFRSRDADSGQPVTSIEMLTAQQGRDVTIRCQVASARFRAYEGACNELVATLRIALL